MIEDKSSPTFYSSVPSSPLVTPGDLGIVNPKFTKFNPGQLEVAMNLVADECRFNLISAPTGCLAGDTIIQIARGSKVRVSNKRTIKEEFRNQYRGKRRSDINTYTRSLIDGSLRHQSIYGVVYSGDKLTYQLELVDGKTIRATLDHKILTSNGWLELDDLSGVSKVIIDVGIRKKEQKKRKPSYRQVQGLKYHPYAGGAKSLTIKPRCLKPEGRLYRVPYHRLVMEAFINDIPLKDFIEICRTVPDIDSLFTFLDPAEFAVHHIDEDTSNNSIHNLTVLTHSDHSSSHNPIQYLRHEVSECQVKKITKYKVEPTYDLSCAEGHHNFVANGIVVHNSGKSLIGITAHKLGDYRTLYLVGTKGLMSQLIGDFGSSGAVDIRGHGNYSCANDASYRFEPICDLPPEECLYRRDVHVASNNRLVISNYAYWMSLAKYSDPNALGKFDLLILDEAHTAPDWLTKASSISIYKQELSSLLGIGLPDSLKDVLIWSSWAAEAKKIARIKYAEVRRQPASSRRSLMLQHIQALGREFEILERVQHEDIEWVASETTNSKGATFTPVWPQEYAGDYLFRGVDKVVLYSATLSPGIRKYLNIPTDRNISSYVEVDSTFDPKRNPFIFVDKHPRLRVDRRLGEAGINTLISRIDQTIDNRLHQKGIIHTRSYNRARDLVNRSRHSDVMLVHGSDNAREVIARFKKSKPPCILVSPSVEEGFDFPGELCRWQILMKVPFLDGRDPLTRARQNKDKKYSTFVTSMDIVQMAGRGMRREDDFCQTIIFDSHWLWFSREAQGYFAEWFRRTWQHVKKIPLPLDM